MPRKRGQIRSLASALVISHADREKFSQSEAMCINGTVSELRLVWRKNHSWKSPPISRLDERSGRALYVDSRYHVDIIYLKSRSLSRLADRVTLRDNRLRGHKSRRSKAPQATYPKNQLNPVGLMNAPIRALLNKILSTDRNRWSARVERGEGSVDVQFELWHLVHFVEEPQRVTVLHCRPTKLVACSLRVGSGHERDAAARGFIGGRDFRFIVKTSFFLSRILSAGWQTVASRCSRCLIGGSGIQNNVRCKVSLDCKWKSG